MSASMRPRPESRACLNPELTPRPGAQKIQRIQFLSKKTCRARGAEAERISIRFRFVDLYIYIAIFHSDFYIQLDTDGKLRNSATSDCRRYRHDF